MLLDIINHSEDTTDKCTGLFDHVNVSQDKACLGALGIQTTLEAADQTQVRVVG